MDEKQRVLLSYYASTLLPVIALVVLVLFCIGSAWVNLNQGEEIKNLKRELNGSMEESWELRDNLSVLGVENAALEEETAALGERVAALAKEKELLLNRNPLFMQDLSVNCSHLEGLDARIREYLAVKGWVCEEGDTNACLAAFMESESVSACSPVENGFCPGGCLVGEDYDCCVAAGNRWVADKGCFS